MLKASAFIRQTPPRSAELSPLSSSFTFYQSRARRTTILETGNHRGHYRNSNFVCTRSLEERSRTQSGHLSEKEEEEEERRRRLQKKEKKKKTDETAFSPLEARSMGASW